MSFFSRLEDRARQVDSLLCVGLDPHPEDLPRPSAEAARDYCLNLVKATADLAVAFKPNSAFFEIYGAEGLVALREVIAAVPAGVPLILDAKRGDIASTATAYARAAFDAMGAGAVTINPYLGRDAVQPFIEDPERGVFLLCKTSNPGAADLQDLMVSERPGAASLSLFETVAALAQRWNQKDNLGLVVGATHPEALQRVRALAPHLWILAPGVGAQGGDLQAALQAGLRADGLGLLIPISRAVARSSDPRAAALAFRDEINRQRQAARQQPAQNLEPNRRARLADGLLDAGCVKFGQFILKSGLSSPIYIDLRQLVTYPDLLGQVAAAYVPLLAKLDFQRLAALPYAALPIATAISLQGGWPFIYPRKEVKTYGTKAEIEGQYQAGEKVVVIDDLTTTGGSKFEAIERLVAADLQVGDVVVLIDRQSGAVDAMAQAGYHLHSVFTLSELLDIWEQNQRVPAEQIEAARQFISRAAAS